jgi:recombination protein RecA
VVKNKVAPPFKIAEFDILYNEGISRESEIIHLATQLYLMEKAGAWYSYQQEKIGQGKENVRIYLKEHPEVMQTLEQKIREELMLRKLPTKKEMAAAAAEQEALLDD